MQRRREPHLPGEQPGHHDAARHGLTPDEAERYTWKQTDAGTTHSTLGSTAAGNSSAAARRSDRRRKIRTHPWTGHGQAGRTPALPIHALPAATASRASLSSSTVSTSRRRITVRPSMMTVSTLPPLAE